MNQWPRRGTEGLATEIPKGEIEQFSLRWRITELALFGSVLRDDFRPESDIDVLVTFDPDARWSLWDLVDMNDELAKTFGRKVDLIERRTLDNPFRRQAIFSTARVIYAA